MKGTGWQELVPELSQWTEEVDGKRSEEAPDIARLHRRQLYLNPFRQRFDFLKGWLKQNNNRPESKALAKTKLSKNSILVFGSESDGISQELLDRSDQAFYIEQLGSTRSINVGCASAVAMYEAVRQLGLLPKDA